MKTITLAFLLIVLSSSLISQEDNNYRIEPPFWWTGMANTELQIMIHGDQVGELSPSLKYPGVELLRVVKTQNPNYLFIYLNIDAQAKTGWIDLSLVSKKSTESIDISFELKARSEGSSSRKGFNSSDVIYLITPDRFANGDASNDEYPSLPDKLKRKDPNGRHGGDIQGIINNLDYIEGLGFTSLWLNPVVENNMPKYSYHGYSATDFYNIDPRFGTLDDYKKLSFECKNRGIKLIMDQIMNHCGLEHWWMKDLPSDDWIHGSGEYKQTSHQRVVLNDPYVANSDIKRFTEGWFVPSMPDMNQDNPLLADYLIQNSIWWVEFADLGGIRHDTHSYAGKEFMKEYSCRIMNEYPNFNIVGEEWTLNPAIIAKWQRGKENPDGYVSCMPSMFDFPLQDAVRRSLTQKDSWNSGWIVAYEALSNDFLYSDPFNLVTFPDNHDMDRFYTQIGEDFELFKMGMVYFACMRGIPQFYYGTEILMTNSVPGNHGLIRTDFPGGWTGDEKNAFTGKGLSKQEAEAQAFVKELLGWRKNSRIIHEGNLMQYAPVDDVYVFFRYLNDEAVMVILNKSQEKRSFQPDNYPERLDSVDAGFDVLAHQTVDLNNFTLQAKSAYIIELN